MTTILIIDSTVRNVDILQQYLNTESIIEVIPQNVNGIEFIYNIIKQYSNIESLHILSHGVSGSLSIGNLVLNNQNILEYSYLSEFFFCLRFS